MSVIMSNHNDGVDRRGFLKCMAWAGTGVAWTISGGIPSSRLLGADAQPHGEISFVQISDSHIGFHKPANSDVTATLQLTVDKINHLQRPPDFLIHTGDLSHTSKPAEFDTMDEVLKSARAKSIFYVPGEHDTSVDDGKQYLQRYGKDTHGNGWYSFDHKGAHFIGLNNCAALDGIGKLGDDQLKWLTGDLAGRSASTPIIVFAHIPLWSVYPDWGWATTDSEQALGLLRRFGSVTVLNGHIHQVMQKVEGGITFHTAMSTAFPQPKPGAAPSPGPMVVPAGELKSVLGITSVAFVPQRHNLAIVDSALAKASEA